MHDDGNVGTIRRGHDRLWRLIASFRLWPGLLRLLGRLGIRRPLKRIYCRLFGPDGGVVELDTKGLQAKFFVHTRVMAESLRRLQGEGPMLDAMLDSVGPGDCVFDIGAEMGLFTCLIAAAVGDKGRVVAFEPASEPYERLQDNLMLNKLHNVQVLQLALSDRNGQGSLYSGARGYAPMLGDLGEIGMKFAVAERVAVVQGDWLVEHNKLPMPRAVKVDVEGFELAVIQGLSKTLSDPACQLLCCEIHPAQLPKGTTPETLTQFLRSLRFENISVSTRGDQLHAVCRKE